MHARHKTLSAVFLAASIGLGTGCSTSTPHVEPANDNTTNIARTPTIDGPFKNEKFNVWLNTIQRNSVKRPDISILEQATINGARDELTEKLGASYKTKSDTEIRALIDSPLRTPEMNEALIIGGTKGMAKALSPHDSYLDVKTIDTLFFGGTSISGVGIMFEKDTKTGGLLIFDLADNGPADKAGVRLGDVILAVNGVSITEKTQREGADLIRGEKGTTVSLRVLHMNETKPVDIDVVRNKYRFPATSQKIVDNIGYVRLRDFSSRRTTDLVVQNMLEMREKIGNDNVRGYILDLRGNPGGLVLEARKLVDAFVDADGAISVTVKGSQYEYSEKTHPGDVLGGKPLAVLIDDGSASAAEIVSGALQDLKRATIVGLQSYGKGSVQTRTPLARAWEGREDAMNITSAMYYLPSGTSIQNIGITPDILANGVPQLLDSHERDLENVLDNPTHASRPARQPTTICDVKGNVAHSALPNTLRDFRGNADTILLCAIDAVKKQSEYTLQFRYTPHTPQNIPAAKLVPQS